MYNLTYPTALTFVVGAFTIDPNYCPLTYTFVTSPPVSPASIVAFDSGLRKFTILSDTKISNLNAAGFYQITVSAESPAGAVLKTLNFQLNLVNPCLAATFLIDRSIIAALTTYFLADLQFSFPVLDRAKITSSELLATCPAF